MSYLADLQKRGVLPDPLPGGLTVLHSDDDDVMIRNDETGAVMGVRRSEFKFWRNRDDTGVLPTREEP